MHFFDLWILWVSGLWLLVYKSVTTDGGTLEEHRRDALLLSLLSLLCLPLFLYGRMVFLQAFLERGDRFWSLKIVKGRKSSKVAAGDAVDAGSGLYKHLSEVHIVPMRLLLLLLLFSLSLLVSKNCWLRRPLASSVVNRTCRMVARCLFSILQ